MPFKHPVTELVAQMEALPQCVMLWDRSLCCIAVNRQTAANAFGLDSLFIKSQYFNDLPMSNDRRARLRRLFDTARASGRKAELLQVISVDNRRLEIETTVIPQYKDELFTGFLSVCHVPLASQSADDRIWNTVYAKWKDLCLVIDSSGRVERCNQEFAGRSPKDWIGRPMTEGFNEHDHPAFEQGIRRAIEQQNETQFELVRRDKRLRITMEPFGVEYTSEKIRVTVEDVTHSRFRQLIEEGRYALLNDALEGSKEALFLIHLSGNIVYRNRAAVRLIPQMPEHADQLKACLKGQLYHADTKEARAVDSLRLFDVLRGEAASLERLLLKQDGEFQLLESVARPLVNGGNAGGYTLWVLRRVMGHESPTPSMSQSAEGEVFIRTAAHDLRTPVNNIRNLSKLLTRAETTDAKDALARRINEAATVLEELLESMMQLSALEAGKGIENHTIDLASLINGVLAALGEEISIAGAHITTQIEVDSFYFAPVFMRSIVYNLVSNAIKYRHTDRVPEITIRMSPSKSGLWVEVSDNGIGIDLNNPDLELFKPFKRLTEHGVGKGVGLSLVRSFVERTGGELFVDSKPNIGSCFRAHLRRADDSVQYGLFDPSSD